MSPFGLELDTQKARNDAFLVGRLAGCGDATKWSATAKLSPSSRRRKTDCRS